MGVCEAEASAKGVEGMAGRTALLSSKDEEALLGSGVDDSRAAYLANMAWRFARRAAITSSIGGGESGIISSGSGSGSGSGCGGTGATVTVRGRGDILVELN